MLEPQKKYTENRWIRTRTKIASRINGKLLRLRLAALGDQVVAGQHLHAWCAQSWEWCNSNHNFQAVYQHPASILQLFIIG